MKSLNRRESFPLTMKSITLLFFVGLVMGFTPNPFSRALTRSWNEGKRNFLPGKGMDDKGASDNRDLKRSYWSYLQNDF